MDPDTGYLWSADVYRIMNETEEPTFNVKRIHGKKPRVQCHGCTRFSQHYKKHEIDGHERPLCIVCHGFRLKKEKAANDRAIRNAVPGRPDPDPEPEEKDIRDQVDERGAEADNQDG